ncbi:MAG: ArsR/SmtB family transcription factor [Actinomycetes bacterium]
MSRILATVECCVVDEPAALIPAGDAAELASLLKALADPVRLRLLRFVAESPDTTACACHMPGALGIAQPTLSHHLRKLVEAGLLAREQRGRWAHYRLRAEAIAPIRAYLDAAVRPLPGPLPFVRPLPGPHEGISQPSLT